MEEVIMEKTYKRVPFNIELAKDIQSGKVEGRIVTDSGILVRILCFDRNGKHQIVGMIDDIDIYLYTANGDVCVDTWVEPHNLFIELPEETPKHEFKPFDRVLVRKNNKTSVKMSNGDECSLSLMTWTPAIYQRRINGNTNYQYLASGILWNYCIPYEGNEHLIGTANNPN